MTEHEQLRALFQAYIETACLQVSMSTTRLHACRQLLRRGITPEDVRAVLTWLKQTVDRSARGFTAASLEFRNAMDPDTLEDRLATLRATRAKRRGAKSKPEVQHSRTLPDGRTETVLGPTPEPEAQTIAADIKRQVAELEKQLHRGGEK